MMTVERRVLEKNDGVAAIDLFPYVNRDLVALKPNAFRINPPLRVFETFCTTGSGVAAGCDWLEEQRSASS
jgi:Ni2+-binding GTPase involved in maturation of urease and hydrogenase